MVRKDSPVRVLYSFPHKLGAGRICYTAWQQVRGLAAAGAEVLVFPGALQRSLPANVRVHPTLARGKLRLPYKLLGSMRACELHDFIVAYRLERLLGEIDVVHTWPLGALQTLRVADRLGIPAVLERPNAHTRFAYEVVQNECHRIGVQLPSNHEHAYKPNVLAKEEKEYQLAYRLLCPSDFVVQTFVNEGFPSEKLVRHTYGFDEEVFYPERNARKENRGLTVLFVGVCAVRKGLHYALDAWLRSPASREGTLLIAGDFLPAYRNKLATMLTHPSIRVLGHRSDTAALMRRSDVLVLPSIEEGSALVTMEALGCGCVLLVSDAAGAPCENMVNSLVHHVGDVDALARHLTMLHENHDLLERLRAAALGSAANHTWTAAGVRLLQVYSNVIAQKQQPAPVVSQAPSGSAVGIAAR